ncbi:MAG TPA: GNAT family N-acetyltransferase [Gammaproteobacteria bacterium]|nr:GNAT family N-acetyltransferase [Gammaproteobacteria bacterium]
MNIRTGIQPGDIGRLLALHGTFYAEHYGLDLSFEAYVAEGLGQFAQAFDADKDCIWIAEENNQLLGSITIAHQKNNTAQLRWFIVAPQAQGRGLGKELINQAIAFCRAQRMQSVFLWTISDLPVAAHLYQQAGFTLTEQKTHRLWGAQHTEQRYDLRL